MDEHPQKKRAELWGMAEGQCMAPVAHDYQCLRDDLGIVWQDSAGDALLCLHDEVHLKKLEHRHRWHHRHQQIAYERIVSLCLNQPKGQLLHCQRSHHRFGHQEEERQLEGKAHVAFHIHDGLWLATQCCSKTAGNDQHGSCSSRWNGVVQEVHLYSGVKEVGGLVGSR